MCLFADILVAKIENDGHFWKWMILKIRSYKHLADKGFNCRNRRRTATISNDKRWNGKIRANFEVSSSLTLLWPCNTDSSNITFINGSLLHFCLFMCNKYNECYECNKQNSRFINNSISNFISSIYKVWKKNWLVLSHR